MHLPHSAHFLLVDAELEQKSDFFLRYGITKPGPRSRQEAPEAAGMGHELQIRSCAHCAEFVQGFGPGWIH